MIDEINQIQESDEVGWQGSEINSTTRSCGVSDGRYAPHGTLSYSLNGPAFQWEFYSEGFVPPANDINRYTQHVLVVYPNPWPGRELICLDGDETWRVPNLNGQLYLGGSRDLGADLENAMLWIVRRDWVDCTGSDEKEPHWSNGHSTPRSTNCLFVLVPLESSNFSNPPPRHRDADPPRLPANHRL